MLKTEFKGTRIKKRSEYKTIRDMSTQSTRARKVDKVYKTQEYVSMRARTDREQVDSRAWRHKSKMAR